MSTELEAHAMIKNEKDEQDDTAPQTQSSVLSPQPSVLHQSSVLSPLLLPPSSSPSTDPRVPGRAQLAKRLLGSWVTST